MILDDFFKEFDEFLNELSKNCKILDDSFFRKSKYINTTKENNCCDSDELIILKRKYKAELIREIKYINSVDSEDKIFAKLKHLFLDMIRDFFHSIDSYSSVTSLKNIYDCFKKDYYMLIFAYIYCCYEKCGINNFISDFNDLGIDFNKGIEFARIKVFIVLNSILERELDEFKSLGCYKEIEKILLEIKAEYAMFCLFGNSNIDGIRNRLKNSIVLEINKYTKRKEIIDDLTKYYGYPNDFVMNLRKNILNDEFESLYYDNVDRKTRIKVKIKKNFFK